MRQAGSLPCAINGIFGNLRRVASRNRAVFDKGRNKKTYSTANGRVIRSDGCHEKPLHGSLASGGATKFGVFGAQTATSESFVKT